MDGNQARRIGLSTPLGEFFDHGLDAILTFVYAAVAVCSLGINLKYPLLGLTISMAVLLLNFFYHWQTYVCGILHFKRLLPLIQSLCTVLYNTAGWILQRHIMLRSLPSVSQEY